MDVKIVADRPPNYEAIRAVFPLAESKGVVFAYGDRIFNPDGEAMPPSLLAHELAHCERQREIGVDIWWDLYLTDGKFRFDEELIAHIAEYRAIMSKYNYGEHAIGRVRQRAIEHVARKLASPLYDRMVTFNQAVTAIRKGARA